MDGSVVGALFGIGFLTIVNVGVVAFSYGRLTQKVKDVSDRVKRIENILNNKGGD